MGRVLAALCSLVVAGCLGAPHEGGGDGDGGGGGGEVPGPTDGLIAYWSMDALLDGNIIEDSVGGRGALCLRCPEPDPEGVVGGSLWFDDAAYALVEWPDLGLASGTISAWVYMETVGDSVVLARPYDANDTDDESVLLGTLTWGGVLLEYTGGDDQSNATVEPGEWNHLAGTWSPDERAIYVNGSIVTFPPQPTTWDDSGLYIGCDYDFGVDMYHWVGAMDDLRLYDRALTPTEVGEILQLEP